MLKTSPLPLLKKSRKLFCGRIPYRDPDLLQQAWHVLPEILELAIQPQTHEPSFTFRHSKFTPATYASASVFIVISLLDKRVFGPPRTWEQSDVILAHKKHPKPLVEPFLSKGLERDTNLR
jgi:hypothetical protein